MTGWPAHPVVHEVNTSVWLGELSRRHGRLLTLGEVPEAAWDDVALPGVDAVWLMGVWERSDVGRDVAMADEGLCASFSAALPDLRPADVLGSPYCVRRYVVDEALGGPEALARARAVLAERGVRLLLDFVPNHVAPDSPWLASDPEAFVRGTPEDLARSPEAFLETGGHVVARGRDPYFPPWPDVVQLDASSPRMREVTVETLVAIGEQCDGVRCDMAMLLLAEVFARTWGERASPAPPQEFWPEVLGRVRERHPDMLFVAEAYWDLESTLQSQGFDHCYDKRLLDRLADGDAASVSAHLAADPTYQRGLVRFLENHDEPRAAATFLPPARERAAAVVIATLPGATLWHEGQLDGRRVRLPVFLARRPDEPVDVELRRFSTELVARVARSGLRSGEWRLLACTGWPDNASCRNLLAWSWSDGDRRHLVVVNLAEGPSQGRVVLPWSDLAGRAWRCAPLLGGEPFDRDGDELASEGLFVDLDAWGWHVLALDR